MSFDEVLVLTNDVFHYSCKCGLLICVIPQFFLDPEGRVPFAGKVAFGFRSAPRALAPALSEPGVLASVVADCQVIVLLLTSLALSELV